MIEDSQNLRANIWNACPRMLESTGRSSFRATLRLPDQALGCILPGSWPGQLQFHHSLFSGQSLHYFYIWRPLMLLRGPAPWVSGGGLACLDHCRPPTASVKAQRASQRRAALPVLPVDTGAADMRGDVLGGLVGEEWCARSLGLAQEPARLQEASTDRLPKTLGQVRMRLC